MLSKLSSCYKGIFSKCKAIKAPSCLKLLSSLTHPDSPASALFHRLRFQPHWLLSAPEALEADPTLRSLFPQLCIWLVPSGQSDFGSDVPSTVILPWLASLVSSRPSSLPYPTAKSVQNYTWSWHLMAHERKYRNLSVIFQVSLWSNPTYLSRLFPV